MKQTKRLFPLIMAVLMILAMIPTVVFMTSAETVQGLSGNGTAKDPYLINSISDWLTLSEHITGNTENTCSGLYFKLMTDLDFSETTMDSIDGITITLGWRVSKNEQYKFGGIFDGNGHTVSNMKIEGAYDRLSVFPMTIDGAVISNLTVKDCTFVGTSKSPYVAGLVSSVEGATVIQNCILQNVTLNHKYTDATGGGHFGGLVGYATTALTVRDCTVDVIYNETNSGSTKTPTFAGILGCLGTTGEASLNVIGCSVTADVNFTSVDANRLFVGGIAGYLNAAAGSKHTIENCSTDIDLDVELDGDQSTAADVATSKYVGVGGLVATSGQSRAQDLSISGCYANLNADFTSVKGQTYTIDKSWVGTLVGGMLYKEGESMLTIRDSHYTAKTSGIKDNEIIDVVGCQQGSTVTSTTEIAYVPALYNGVNVWKNADARAAIVAYGTAAKAYIDAPNGTAAALGNVDWTTYAEGGVNAAVINTNTDLTYVGSSVIVLDSCVTLRHYFTRNNTSVTSVTVNGTAVALTEKGTYVIADIEVAPVDFATKLDVKIGDATVLSYCVYNYCAIAASCDSISTIALNVIVSLKNMTDAMAIAAAPTQN